MQAEMQAERRLANECYPYTYADFLEHYGDVAHSIWLATLLAFAEPTLEQPYRQHLSRAAQPGDQRASSGFAVAVRSAPQPLPLPKCQIPLVPSMHWLRRSLVTSFEKAVQWMMSSLLDTAVTVQYDSAREAARQLGVEVPLEPFTRRQQRQSRMEGGEDADGSLREYVALAPPVEQLHLQRERCRAAAESRTPLSASAAYGALPLTGAFQSTFPAYRQTNSFASLGEASLLIAASGTSTVLLATATLALRLHLLTSSSFILVARLWMS